MILDLAKNCASRLFLLPVFLIFTNPARGEMGPCPKELLQVLNREQPAIVQIKRAIQKNIAKTGSDQEILQAIPLPDLLHGEVRKLNSFIDSEIKNLLEIKAKALRPETITGENIESVLNGHPRFSSFKKAWKRIGPKIREIEGFYKTDEGKILELITKRELIYIREFQVWLQNLEIAKADLQELKSTKVNNLYDYLFVFSEYLNHFIKEPKENWISGNKYFLTHFEPESFLYHSLIIKKRIFPNGIYLPTCGLDSVAKLNLKVSFGINPVAITKGGNTLFVDGVENLSPATVAAHDLAHLPIKEFNRPEFGLIYLRLLQEVTQSKRFFSWARSHSVFKARIEALFFYFFREVHTDLDSFIKGKNTRDWRLSLVDETWNNFLAGDVLSIALGANKYTQKEDLEKDIQWLRETLRDIDSKFKAHPIQVDFEIPSVF